MKIKGIVTKIIKPEETKDYMPSIIENKYNIVIESLNLPKGFFKRLFYKYKNVWYWAIVSDSCNYKIGDIVELEIEPFMIESGYYKIKDEN